MNVRVSASDKVMMDHSSSLIITHHQVSIHNQPGATFHTCFVVFKCFREQEGNQTL